jgi:type I restriction enzyme S subunit
MGTEHWITENIDLWTSAINAKSTQGRGGSKKLELYGIKKLRELILELAVRGKLVQQDPKDEPASILLERIAAERVKLTKLKIIKKPKSQTDIVDTEMAFTLPPGWKWDRLQNMTRYIQRGIGPQYDDLGTVRVISQKCVQWSGFDLEPSRYVANGSLTKYQTERFLQKNDLLWNSTGTGTVGRIVELEVAPDKLLVADSHVTVIRPLEVLGGFLKAYISAPIIQSRIEPNHENSLVSGSTKQVELNTSAVEALEIPVPPKAEQIRIIAKVDELMALCDQMERQSEASLGAHQRLIDTLLESLTTAKDAGELSENWARLSDHFDTLICTDYAVQQLKQTIMQLAVMGKLVSQDPTNEPASELLNRIAAEKQELIRNKKIKKQKPLPKITEAEKPFLLPKGWEWARIGDASTSTDYGLSDKSKTDLDGIPVLTMGHIQSGQVILENSKFVPFDVNSLPELFLESRDLLYNRTNSAELVGKTGIFVGRDNAYTFASYLIRIRTLKSTLLPEFININMQTTTFRKTQINPHLKQQCGQANVNGTTMRNMLIAVPPQQEIEKIVSKTNHLLAICDQISEKLRSRDRTQKNFAELVVKSILY